MFGSVFRDARRAKCLTGAQLAKMAGCTQSAISQFEGGKRTALRHETVEKICGILGIEMPAELGEGAAQAGEPVATHCGGAALREPFCPNPGCPSNVPFVVDGAVAFMPVRQPDPGAVFCPWCGEVLQRECPQCGAPTTQAAFCPQCGARRVDPPEGIADPAGWAASRRAEIAELRGLVE